MLARDGASAEAATPEPRVARGLGRLAASVGRVRGVAATRAVALEATRAAAAGIWTVATLAERRAQAIRCTPFRDQCPGVAPPASPRAPCCAQSTPRRPTPTAAQWSAAQRRGWRRQRRHDASREHAHGGWLRSGPASFLWHAPHGRQVRGSRKLIASAFGGKRMHASPARDRPCAGLSPRTRVAVDGQVAAQSLASERRAMLSSRQPSSGWPRAGQWTGRVAFPTRIRYTFVS